MEEGEEGEEGRCTALQGLQGAELLPTVGTELGPPGRAASRNLESELEHRRREVAPFFA